MAARSVHGFARKACRIFHCKSGKNLLKSSPASVTHILTGLRANGSFTALSLSSKTRQLLTSLNKNGKWNKSLSDSINRSSAVVCLLTTGTSPLTIGLCCSSDELPTDGDEDSTNRKKRIYLLELLNDDP